MNDRQASTILGILDNALDADHATWLGRVTGFTRRLRTVTPHRLLVTLLTAFSCQNLRTLADIHRAFHAMVGQGIEYKPFHNQLRKKSFPRLMEAVFRHLVKTFVGKVLAPVPASALRAFDDIVIHDGSSFGVYAGLADALPGRFGKDNPAAAAVHLTLSLLREQPVRVSVTSQAEGETNHLPPPRTLRRKLLLADRGYGKLDYCRAVDEAEGFFAIRLKSTINPTVLSARMNGCLVPCGIGRSLRDNLPSFRFKSVDLDVEWTRPGEAPLRFRLILRWNPQINAHWILVTNLPRGEFSPAAVAALYRLRWQVELLFKELKSHANLHAFRTRQESIAKGLIWASLCAAVLKRFLAHAAQRAHDGLDISTQRAAMALTLTLPRLMASILSGHGVEAELRALLGFLARCARRAHPGRDRKTGRLRTGLRPAYLTATGAVRVKV